MNYHTETDWLLCRCWYADGGFSTYEGGETAPYDVAETFKRAVEDDPNSECHAFQLFLLWKPSAHFQVLVYRLFWRGATTDSNIREDYEP